MFGICVHTSTIFDKNLAYSTYVNRTSVEYAKNLAYSTDVRFRAIAMSQSSFSGRDVNNARRRGTSFRHRWFDNTENLSPCRDGLNTSRFLMYFDFDAVFRPPYREKIDEKRAYPPTKTRSKKEKNNLRSFEITFL